MKMKRILTALLALVLTASLLPSVVPAADAASTSGTQHFTDVTPDKWYYEAVNAMAEAGILNGYGDGTFRPNQPMTAGEFATVLWNLTYGDYCKASELLMYVGNNNCDLYGFNNGVIYFNQNHTNYQQFEKVGKLVASNPYWTNPDAKNIQITTWDGPVSVAIYGDSYYVKGTTAAYTGVYAATTGYSSQISSTKRATGQSHSTFGLSDKTEGVTWCARNIDGTDIANMSKDYVTRGFAISELVNVLRETNNLYYYSKPNIKQYPTGTSIPDWSDITNIYHDICANCDTWGMYQTPSYWNYVTNPGKTVISGGFANTWFSTDILLAYQYGLVQGKDSTGKCDVGAYMTRAEVCQMLYNADVLNTLHKYGDRRTSQLGTFYAFQRDGKLYSFRTNAYGEMIAYYGTYNANTAPAFKLSETPNSRYIYYPNDGIDTRKQEWPTHPEFWGN